MTFEFPEPLHVDGHVYHLHAYPLDGYLKNRPDWPRFRNRPGNGRGYAATWAVDGDALYLTRLSAPADDPLAQLFPGVRQPVVASWFDGILRGCRGDRRHVSYPSRQIYDDEIYLEIKAGRVTRQWLLDLRPVPDKTDEEIRLTLPRFLWPARLRDDGAG
jgi:hypothetical protein